MMLLPAVSVCVSPAPICETLVPFATPLPVAAVVRLNPPPAAWIASVKLVKVAPLTFKVGAVTVPFAPTTVPPPMTLARPVFAKVFALLSASMAAVVLPKVAPAALITAGVAIVPFGLITNPPPVTVSMLSPRLLAAVATVNSCEPLIASVDVAETTPAATLVTCRSAPVAPTETTAVGAVPAAVPPLIVNAPVLGADTVVALPIPTEPSRPAEIEILLPSAKALLAATLLLLPKA